MFDKFMYIKFDNKFLTYFVNIFSIFGVLLIGFDFGFTLFCLVIYNSFFSLIGVVFVSLSLISFFISYLHLLSIYDKYICHPDLSSCSPDLQSLDNKEL